MYITDGEQATDWSNIVLQLFVDAAVAAIVVSLLMLPVEFFTLSVNVLSAKRNVYVRIGSHVY